MLGFALVIWQAFGFPEVENPMPDRIGFGSIVGLAGAGGVLGGILSVVVRPQRREQFVSMGTLAGFFAGFGFYALSLLVQLLSDS